MPRRWEASRAFPDRKSPATRTRESEVWFQKGLELEETGAPVEQAVEAYRKVLELNPSAAGALVNLGTIYYRQRKFADAEQYYKRAIEVDASYSLAQFNLGNLYDEQNRLKEALEHYRCALRLNPNYADAHFNLALLCERTGRDAESRTPLEDLPETGQLRSVGGDRPAAVGALAASRDPIVPHGLPVDWMGAIQIASEATLCHCYPR